MAILDWLIGGKLDSIAAGIGKLSDGLSRVNQRLDSVFATLKELPAMSQALDRLKTEVQESTAVAKSAVQLISGLSAQIRDLKDDPAALEALADELDASQQELAAAIAANTTAEDEPADEADW